MYVICLPGAMKNWRGMPVGMWMTSPALTAIRVPPLIPLPCISWGAVVWGSVDHLAAVHQGGFPALDDHDIGLCLMELRAPILFAMRDRKYVIAEVLLVGDAGGRHAIGPYDYILMWIITPVRRGCRQGEGEEKEQAGRHRLLSSGARLGKQKRSSLRYP